MPLQDSLHGTGMRWQLGGSSRGILRPANWKPSILTARGHDSSAPLTKVWAGWHYNFFPEVTEAKDIAGGENKTVGIHGKIK